MKPLVAPTAIARNRHAFQHARREAVEQHAVLEGAGLALVGVADDVFHLARSVARAGELGGGREAGAASAAQIGALDLVLAAGAAARDGGVQPVAAMERGPQQRDGAADVVGNLEQLRRPFPQRGAGVDEIGDEIDALRRQVADRHVVDENGDAVVAQARAGGEADADEAVGRDFAAAEREAGAQALVKSETARHPVGDIVREQHAIGADRAVVEERVEAYEAVDAGARQVQPRRHRFRRLLRDPAKLRLDLLQNLQHEVRIAAITRDGRFDAAKIRQQALRALASKTVRLSATQPL